MSSNKYADKIVLVTGGNSGIGRELSLQLASARATVIVWGRNQETGLSLVELGKKDGGRIIFETVDVQDYKKVEEKLNALIKRHGRIDYVFHCAGIILGGEIRDNTIDDARSIMQTNVLGTTHVAYYAYRLMAQQGSGHLVLLSSGAGIFPVPLMGVYSASKFAILGLSEVMRMEGKGLGVMVSAVAPGLVDTPIYDRAQYSRTDKQKTLDLLKNKFSMMPPEKAARIILKGVSRNLAIIHTHSYIRLSWRVYRYLPSVYRFWTRQIMFVYRKRYRSEVDKT